MLVVGLDAGGAERVTSTLANHWAANGNAVCVISYAPPSQQPAYDLHPGVEYARLDLMRESSTLLSAVLNNLRRGNAVRRVVTRFRPDVLIGHQDRESAVAIVVGRATGIPVIARSSTHPAPGDIGHGWSRIRSFTFRYADAIVAQTERAANFFAPRVGSEVVVIPNPLRPFQQELHAAPSLYLRTPSIVALGSLRDIKNHPLLLRAFALVAREFSAWSLTILGEGPERGALERLRAQLGLEERVHLPGLVRNPAAVLRQAQIFVHTSDHEGFPNALSEAMACGLPAVATDCESGPREIISQGIDGLLVPVGDIEALAAALRSLMMDEPRRAAMGMAALRVRDRYDVAAVALRWEALIRRVQLARRFPKESAAVAIADRTSPLRTESLLTSSPVSASDQKEKHDDL